MRLSEKTEYVPCPILMAEDDPDDRLFIEQAFRDLRISGKLHFVENGEELMNFLRRRGDYSDPEVSPRPVLILLDLNMPKKDGRQCLVEIKSDPALKSIPVVVWTTSNLEEDITRCYDAGADSFITKPASYPGLLEAIRGIGRKWLAVLAEMVLDSDDNDPPTRAKEREIPQYTCGRNSEV